MNKAVLLIFILQVTLIELYAQANMSGNLRGSMYLYPNSQSVPSAVKRGSYVTPHMLGDTITSRLNSFEHDYVYFKPGNGAYAVEEQIILKPSIYKAVKSIIKFHEESVLKNGVMPASAATSIGEIVVIGRKLLNYSTTAVEKQVRKLKSVEDKEAYLKSLTFAPFVK